MRILDLSNYVHLFKNKESFDEFIYTITERCKGQYCVITEEDTIVGITIPEKNIEEYIKKSI